MHALVGQLQFFSHKKLPVIQQTEAAECGLACLAMVAGFYGFRASLTELRTQFNLSLQGATLLDLINFAEHLHLSGRPLRIELEQLAQLQLPAVLHWDMNHFVVLEQVKAGQCVIVDPARGRLKMPLSQVSDHFTGIALELLPTSNFQQKKQGERLGFRDFLSSVTGLKRSLSVLLALTVLLQIFTLATPYYIQVVVDDVLLSGDQQLLIVLAIGFGLLLLFDGATTVLRSFVMLHLGSALNLQMAANMFHHLVRLPLSFFEKRHIGDVLSRFGSLGHVKEMLVNGLLEAVIDGFMALTILFVLFWYSSTLALVVCVALLLYMLVRLMLYPKYREATENQILAIAKEHSHQIETLRAMQTVKLFGAETNRESNWQQLYVDVTNQDIRIGMFNISYQLSNKLISGLENILVVYLGARAVLDGGFSTGMLFAFLAYKGQFIERSVRLVDKLIQFRMLSLHFERLADIALTPAEVLSGEGKARHEVQGALAVQQLSFRYSDNAPLVINQLNFQVRAGESVALTGPSGYGKTTLLKLILGLLQPSSGRVLIDGLPSTELDQRHFRAQIASVMQDDQLLSGSIRDNICFFAEQIDDTWLQQCARMAAIAEDIERMPMKYATLIGDMGSTLSGGQKQRILLARALYRRPKILLMDEATSHLDTQTEAAVNRAIHQLNITRLIIAHRPETIAAADRVIDLEALTQQQVA